MAMISLGTTGLWIAFLSPSLTAQQRQTRTSCGNHQAVSSNFLDCFVYGMSSHLHLPTSLLLHFPLPGLKKNRKEEERRKAG